MRLLISALTALMLFATPVVAGNWEDAWDAYGAGDYRKSMRLLKSLIEEGSKWAPAARLKVDTMYLIEEGAPKDPAKKFHWYRKGSE